MKITSYSNRGVKYSGTAIEQEIDKALFYIKQLDTTLTDIQNIVRRSGVNLVKLDSNTDRA